MNKILYYYSVGKGAPSHVSRCIIHSIFEKKVDFNISLIPQKLNYSYSFPNNVTIATKSDFFKLSNYCIVHLSQSPSVFPNKKFILFLASIVSNTKIIANYHGDPVEEFKIKFKNRNLRFVLYVPDYLLSCFIMKQIDIIIVNSFLMKRKFEEKFGLSNIEVIPNGIESHVVNYNKISVINQNDESFNLFYHGRLSPEKGVDILLNAFSILNEHIQKDIHLYLVGEGEQREYLEQLSHDLCIEDNVHFLGKVTNSVLYYLMSSASVAIYPSVYEPFSLAVLEALSLVNGPVIYSNKIGLNDFVVLEGYDFWTIDPTVNDLSDSLIKAVTKKYDSSLITKQREFARKYEWSNVANQYIELYGKIINRNY